MQPKIKNMTNKLKRNVDDERHFRNSPKIQFADLDISEDLKKTNEMKMLDTPLKEMFCEQCRRTVKPNYQVRLSSDECGQKTDIIAWTCSNCEYEHATPDDVSILSAEIIEL